MILGYLLLLIVPIAAIAYIVWDHKRKAAAREAASVDRLQEILGAVQQARSSETAAAAPPVKPADAPLYVRRQRVLNAPQTLLYYLLRTALPDYLVFAHVPLSMVLEPGADASGYTRDESARRLTSRTIDCLLTDRTMRPVVAIQLASPAETPPDAGASPAAWFSAAGVRYIELDPRALPRKDAIRKVVLGESVTVPAVASPTA